MINSYFKVIKKRFKPKNMNYLNKSKLRNRQLYLLLFILGCSIAITSCDSVGEYLSYTGQFTGSKTNFGEDWKFKRLGKKPAQEWEHVNLPHSVKIEPLVVNDQWQGTSIYKKEFAVDKPERQKWFFDFEGVMQEAAVKINDSLVKTHVGGYLPFSVDATPFLVNDTTNVIEVVVKNVDNPEIPPGKPLENVDFNYYGGIYRNVHLRKTNPVYITNAVHADEVNGGGLLVHFQEVSDSLATGFLKTHVRNDSEQDRVVRIRASLSSGTGKSFEFFSEPEEIDAGEDYSFIQDLIIEGPQLWSPADPNLYDLKVDILEGERILHTEQIRTGIRDIALNEDGFFLNGERLFLNGTNRHQEYPYIGYSLSDEANYRDAYKIKKAGFNFVRLAHYPHSPAFMRAADELGLILMDAIPGWQFFKEGEFAENALQDIKDMVRRDRNHPSVVFWENSLNESPMTEEFILRANEVLDEELPYNDTFSAGWIDHPAYDLFIPARQHAKPPHYWNQYDEQGRPILIAEYGDWEYYAQNAGFNQTAFDDLKEEERTSRQLRGAGERRLLQQALNFQEAANSNLKGEQTIGMANWLMFDYNRGYAPNIEASGISDIFRLPKFSYYFFQSQKDPVNGPFSGPMVFLASYWTPDSPLDITVFSNTEEVALYLNDVLLARKKPKTDRFSDELPHPPFHFEVPAFKAGELKAVGYIDGKEVASDVVKTPGEPEKIVLDVDLSGKSLATKHPDVVFVYAKLVDANGIVVPSAENEVSFELASGRGAKLIGQNPVKAEAGVATILLRTADMENKKISIIARAEGLEGTRVRIQNKR